MEKFKKKSAFKGLSGKKSGKRNVFSKMCTEFYIHITLLQGLKIHYQIMH